MRDLLLLGLALGLSTAASAQNRATLKQQGDGNAASVIQEGTRHALLVKQLGIDNVATVEQDGYRHRARVRQRGEANVASVEQAGGIDRGFIEVDGDANVTTILQEGVAHRARKQRANSGITVEGDHNSLSITQAGANQAAGIWADGHDNEAQVAQSGERQDTRLVLGRPRGAGRSYAADVTVDQAGEDHFIQFRVNDGSYTLASFRQGGAGNQFTGQSTGDSNTFDILQLGTDNRVDYAPYSGAVVAGDLNDVSVSQTGHEALALVRVTGDSNAIAIIQQ